ncbi:phosphatidylglycerophosphatase A family protein [Lactiplantibacillus mudanjiangensis]|uniref:Phosphatidylglycerophosphatase A [Lactobacillus sp.] n=1 Tax=Lactiplantibacillus mudanjiangensis TaxID=1296538 RepID=A0A660DZH8_9LACO|nr:phosphatidylglycerophosphatase A [Lactiplantibacillus mudanjiangensis]VDG21357.1 phosphatidylglycerophosphatase A [Lactobacillus sp.] [Lactiplantibacillus mudanjiangensis]VDG23561.1 phosphatidylglycerophosphatase A [Lactobacillus sp.] [Lactiplantibacillus mudanjiangensis]VDG28795.1 phosphatidylglycerophosphatase A [Lactobacillus sp.] [Lactiplantibacillus mudanjiangensis]VDG32191.1 phosphatidylglycerophosphatase A [Lactobacillus sp.] [Lactiplantibacillus mudanjiangensis]
MYNKTFKYPDKAAYTFVIDALAKKGITYKEIAQITFNLQTKYLSGLTLAECETETQEVLHKRELLNNAMVALELDRLATEKQLSEPLQTIVANDAGVFGVDEGLALNMANIYGTIGVTNYGYVDKVKEGVIKQLDTDKSGVVNTFIDDLVGAIAAAVAAKIAHKYA